MTSKIKQYLLLNYPSLETKTEKFAAELSKAGKGIYQGVFNTNKVLIRT